MYVLVATRTGNKVVGRRDGRRRGPSAEEGPLRCQVAGGVFVLSLQVNVCKIEVYVKRSVSGKAR